MDKICMTCGKIFDAKVFEQKYCCNECRCVGVKRATSEKKLRAKAEAERKEKAKGDLVKMTTEARKQGMSYGQLQAMETLERMKGM